MVFKRKSIDQYFLEKECPYTKRRPIKLKTLYWSIGILCSGFLLFVLFFEEKKEAPSFDKVSSADISVSAQAQTVAAEQSKFSWSIGSSLFSSNSGIPSQNISRNRSASQVIRRSESDPLGKIPIGTTLQASLANRVALSGGTSPVVAEITGDSNDSSSLLSFGSKVLGNGTFDETNGRISVRFHTVVSPDGEQKGIQAIAMMPDGSAGIVGNYHSAETERQVGKVLSHFIGGLADGLKSRTAPSYSGNSYEPGSIRNGILNGVTLSAEDRARDYSDQLSRTKASIEISPGTSFLIYLEKEFP